MIGSFGSVDWRRFSLFGVLAAVTVVFSLLSDRFFDFENLANLLLQSSVTGLAAIGLTFVILTAGIDLSVGSVMNLALVTAVIVSGSAGQMEYTVITNWLAYPAAILTGTLLGALNGGAILAFRLNPLIVTLATMSLFRGIALHANGGKELLVFGDIRVLGRSEFLFGIGYPVILMFALAMAGSWFLKHVRHGRYVFAIGGSERSAHETGLPYRTVVVGAYAFTGLCAALAGLVLVGRIGAINPDLGWEFEFTVITAVVLGGTSLLGGRGSVWGSLIAAVLLSTISNGLNLIGADPFIYDVVRGVVLLLAVTLDAMANRAGMPAIQNS